MKASSVTISLVSHRQSALCARLLDDLARLAPPTVEKVILTVNVPEERPEERTHLPFALEIIRNPRPLGFAENHNQAFAHCATEFFAVLNPDLRFERDPFPTLIAHAADEGVGVVSPQVLEADGAVADHARRLVTPMAVLRRRFHAEATSASAEPEWLAGMFMLFRSAVFHRLGGFDTKFRLYCEDVDLCARARLAGLRLEVAHEVSVAHLAQRASRRSMQPLLWHVSSLIKLWTSPVFRDYRALLAAETRRSGKAA